MRALAKALLCLGFVFIVIGVTTNRIMENEFRSQKVAEVTEESVFFETETTTVPMETETIPSIPKWPPETTTQKKKTVTTTKVALSTTQKVITTTLPEIIYDDNYIINISKEELKTFCRLLFAECGNSDEIEQISVAASIINRCIVNTATMTEVIFEPSQYSPVRNGQIWTNWPYTRLVTQNEGDSMLEIAKRALNGEDPTEEPLGGEGALYFYTPKYCSQKALSDRATISNKISFTDREDKIIFYRIWD